MGKNCQDCRENVFDAAVRAFARHGYSGASLQDIVAEAGVTKPTLYYYFKSKEGLFNALLEHAFDEFYRRMQVAAARCGPVRERLVEMLADAFEFARERKDLIRLSLSGAFAAPGEMPVSPHVLAKRRRNFEFVHDVIKLGIAEGVLDDRLPSEELANGIYGALSFQVMTNVLLPGIVLNRKRAEQIVALFMDGACKKNLKSKSAGRLRVAARGSKK